MAWEGVIFFKIEDVCYISRSQKRILVLVD